MRCLRFLALLGAQLLAYACATGETVGRAGPYSGSDDDASTGGASSRGDASAGAMSATGGASSSSGGSVEQAMCANAEQKRCGGLCIFPNVEFGCGLTGCTPCPTILNGYPTCAAAECGFECNGGFARSGSECLAAETGDAGPAACTNGQIDTGETDIDCGGGDCSKCADGRTCADNTDCASGVCGSVGGAMVCVSASCRDGVHNGAETDVDCGGNCGPTCLNGQMCESYDDCAGGECASGVCECTPFSCADIPGQCGVMGDGCGETMTCDCASGEVCNAGTCGPPMGTTFEYQPANFEPNGLDYLSVDENTVLDCGVSTFDSSTMTFGNWCNQKEPLPVVQAQPAGPELVVVPVRNLSVAAGATIRLTGARPVAFAVFGDANISGAIDVSATGTTPGAGGNWSCASSQGGNGQGSTARFGGASGGGGGGLGTSGGKAGTADTDGSSSNGGNGGSSRGNDQLVPLLGGCAGGQAGGCGTAGGAGGGAVQLSVAGSLRVSGVLRANGGNGSTPCGVSDEGGGTGGGSGGAILLEAQSIDTSGSTIEASGGRGGANGRYAGIYPCGGTNGAQGSTNASSPGSDSVSCQGGSPGAGGGYGRILFVDR